MIKTCKEFKDNLENFQKINILGTEYCFKQYFRDIESNDAALGLCDFWNKIIYIDFEWYIKAEENGFGCINRMYTTIRHELIHAFLYEMGNMDDSLNEELADAISIKATQFVQMLHPFMDESRTNISTIDEASTIIEANRVEEQKFYNGCKNCAGTDNCGLYQAGHRFIYNCNQFTPRGE